MVREPVRAPVSEPLLACENLGFLRAGRRVLHEVSRVFAGGEWTAVVGPNGAGKSTWLALLAGLLGAGTGGVRLAGRPIMAWPVRERARRVTWLGQAVAAEGDLAVHDIVRLGRLPQHGLLGTPTAADEAAVAAAMDETETSGLALRRLRELSGGERQRVLLARALAADADVLLLDEPAIHLDAPHQRRMIRSLRARAARGAAVVSVLHDITLALAADRLVVLAEGRIRADGTPDDDAVRDVLTEVFDRAFTIEPVVRNARTSWAAIPLM